MEILVLSKRQYTSRDLLGHRYGRLYELPEALAQRGHRVRGLATSYRWLPDAAHTSPSGVQWSATRPGLATPWYWHQFFKAKGQPRPDVIWASSDALHCIAAERIGRMLHIPVVLDLYDNYDHFGMTDLPGIRRLYHAACKRANCLTVVSHSLAEHVQRNIAPAAQVSVIPNGVPTRLFHPRPRQDCRETLGLPKDARIIGTAGAIHADRGIDDLYRAFLELARHDDRLYLAIAGPRDKTPLQYPHSRIIDLGILDWQDVPLLINALDILVVCNRDDSFGRFCHPLKLMEALACRIPVCTAAVGDTRHILINTPESLYQPGDHQQLAHRLRGQLDTPSHTIPTAKAFDWYQQAILLEKTLQTISPTGH